MMKYLNRPMRWFKTLFIDYYDPAINIIRAVSIFLSLLVSQYLFGFNVVSIIVAFIIIYVAAIVTYYFVRIRGRLRIVGTIVDENVLWDVTIYLPDGKIEVYQAVTDGQLADIVEDISDEYMGKLRNISHSYHF